MGELLTEAKTLDYKLENPWQISLKSIDDKWSYIFNNNLYTDIVLIVGENLTQIPCHKIILVLNSPVFELMLSSRWASNKISNQENRNSTLDNSNKNEKLALEENCAIKQENINLPEDDAEKIKLLISCFYANTIKSVEDALEIIILAKKYICSNVIEKCVQFLKTASNERNIIQIYQTACLVEESDLVKNSENFILSKACHLVRLGEFSKLTYEQLKYFISHDDLNADEVDLFNAVYNWGQIESEKDVIDENNCENKNICKILEDILPLIRFPCMSLEDFTTHVVSKNVLPLAQVVDIYKFLTTPTKNTPISLPTDDAESSNKDEANPDQNVVPFNTHARSRKIFTYVFKRLRGYGYNFGKKWQNFAFDVDHDIKLVSLGFYRAIKPNVELTVSAKILNFDMTEEFGKINEEKVTSSLDEDVFYMKFPQPIKIYKGKSYTISYFIQGEDTLYKFGEPVQVTLACSTEFKIVFNFKEAVKDTDLDQVPELCFQI